MSEQGKSDIGYPNTQQLTSSDYIYVQPCGGLGGAICPGPLGAKYYVYPIRIPKFVVFNRRMFFRNPELFSIDPHTDGGFDGLCDNSLDTRVPWKISFSVDGVLTDDEMQAGAEFDQAPPFEIEVGHLKLPQPTDPSWENKIFVHIWHGDPLHVQFFGNVQLDLIKHDYDIKL